MSLELVNFIVTEVSSRCGTSLEGTLAIKSMAEYYSSIYHTTFNHEDDIEHKVVILDALEKVLSEYTTVSDFREIIDLAKEG